MNALCIFALLSAVSSAEQLAFDVEKGGSAWSFSEKWVDAEGRRHTATFSLPADQVRADLEEPLHFKLQEANQAMAQAVRRWAEGRPGPQVTARVQGGGVQLQATGQSRARIKEALAAAAEVRDRALQDYLREHGFTMVDGGVMPDHPRHVVDYAPALSPVVLALGGPGESPRVFADLALSFVQSIPYEQASKARDRFRRPLSLLGRNKGDCDSKSTLFLGLMRAAWPQVPLGVVTIPGHAFVALGLPVESGDAHLDTQGHDWLLAEPVGPRLAPAGEVARQGRRKARRGKATLRVVPEG